MRTARPTGRLACSRSSRRGAATTCGSTCPRCSATTRRSAAPACSRTIARPCPTCCSTTFTTEWREWAAGKQALIRNQAHGSPANILDLYAASGIPEIEGTDLLRIKFASSAGHVTGKPLVSAEAATWLDDHFLSSLGIGQAGARSLLRRRRESRRLSRHGVLPARGAVARLAVLRGRALPADEPDVAATSRRSTSTSHACRASCSRASPTPTCSCTSRSTTS